jgi:hypothetical protein
MFKYESGESMLCIRSHIREVKRMQALYVRLSHYGHDKGDDQMASRTQPLHDSKRSQANTRKMIDGEKPRNKCQNYQ